MKSFLTSKKFLVIINVILIIILVSILCRKRDNYDGGVVTRDINNSYKLTNPILDYENLVSGDGTVIPVGLVNEKVDDLEKVEGISLISLYYRDLNNGQWIGVNEKEDFSPASLLKVPTMIAFLKDAEYDEDLLDKRVVVDENDDLGVSQNIKSGENILPGQEYSMLEMIDIMITRSDNTAAQVVLDHTKPDNIKNVFSSIGVPFIDTKTEPIVRVKDYAGFFRVLYNSSYLNRKMSELALEILSVSEYKDGLVAGVPKDVTVAHKFGERAVLDDKGKIAPGQTQIHDCGIVYYPKSPYLLCIMTRGSNLSAQQNAIKELSMFIYNELD